LTPVHTHTHTHTLSSPLSFAKRMLSLCNYYNGYACVWAAYYSRWGQNMLLALPGRVPHKWGSALSKASCKQSGVGHHVCLGHGEPRWGYSDELGSVLGNKNTNRGLKASRKGQKEESKWPVSSLRWSGHVGFRVDNVTVGQVLSENFGFPVSFRFTNCSICRYSLSHRRHTVSIARCTHVACTLQDLPLIFATLFWKRGRLLLDILQLPTK
jgi:hypothetical protein